MWVASGATRHTRVISGRPTRTRGVVNDEGMNELGHGDDDEFVDKKRLSFSKI